MNKGISSSSSKNALQRHNAQLHQDTIKIVEKKTFDALNKTHIELKSYPISQLFQVFAGPLEMRGFDLTGMELAQVPEKMDGDFGIPLAQIARQIPGTNPNALAKELAEELNGSLPRGIQSITACGMYLNLVLDYAPFTEDIIVSVLGLGDQYGHSDSQVNERVVLDYSSPNTAKEMHVAHLRSTVIGESIARILDMTGALTYRINHLGDWGTQFGKLIVAYELLGDKPDIQDRLEKDPIGALAELYARFHTELVESDPKLEDEARDRFSRLEKGDAEILALWKKFSDWSIQEFIKMYDRLGVTFDAFLGESFYEAEMAKTIEDAVGCGLAYYEGDSIVVPFRKYQYEEYVGGKKKTRKDIGIDVSVVGDERRQRILAELNEQDDDSGKVNPEILDQLSLPDENRGELENELEELISIEDPSPSQLSRISQIRASLSDGDFQVFLLRKGDGGSLYQTRDIAALRRRKELFDASHILYVVGSEQSDHFTKCFTIAQALEYINGDEPKHLAFGLMNMGGKKISSRKGGAFRLEDLLDLARDSVLDQDSMTKRKDKERMRDAEIIGQGAVVFNDLGKDRTSKIEFNLEKMLSLTDASGPYIQYAAVRAQSILKKFPEAGTLDVSKIRVNEDNITQQEKELVRILSTYPVVLSRSSKAFKPHIVGSYLLSLAQAFNSFYAAVNISESEGDTRDVRLQLTNAVLQVMKNGLEALCMEIPTRM